MGRIQARWRGLSVRRYLIVFRRELKRHREVRASMVFRIQRTVRMWSHSKRASKWRLQRAGKHARDVYLAERASKNRDDACNDGTTNLRKAYITERYDPRTPLNDGLVLYKWENFRRMGQQSGKTCRGPKIPHDTLLKDPVMSCAARLSHLFNPRKAIRVGYSNAVPGKILGVSLVENPPAKDTTRT